MSFTAQLSSLTPARIALLSTGVLATAVVSYAIVFDYRRRNDPVFRRKLQKEHKKLQKSARAQADNERQSVVASLRRASALVEREPMPQDVESKEQYFMEQVGFGEQLAARGPENYVAAAVSFYRALRVYPAPTELITIYQKTQPPELFQYVMELISLSMVEEAPSASIRSRDPRDAPSSEALLTEIIEEIITPTSPRASSETGSSPPSTGSFVVVEEETITVDQDGTVTDEIIDVVVGTTEDPPEETD